jgi:SAM-dependent methyltransferase
MDLTGLTPEEVAVRATRRALAHVYIDGEGVEVGAGNRPVILPETARCFYGDVRDKEAFESYFGEGSSEKSPIPMYLDAQTLSGVEDHSLDFVISAHVIEHLHDALGAFRNAIRVLKPGGIFMLIVPDKRFTFDHLRPVTPLEHLIRDANDGGASTLIRGLSRIRLLHPSATSWSA